MRRIRCAYSSIYAQMRIVCALFNTNTSEYARSPISLFEPSRTAFYMILMEKKRNKSKTGKRHTYARMHVCVCVRVCFISSCLVCTRRNFLFQLPTKQHAHTHIQTFIHGRTTNNNSGLMHTCTHSMSISLCVARC